MSKVLVVVDMQNDFCTGVLANPAAEKIIPDIAKKCREEEAVGTKILFTRDTHFKDFWGDTVEGKLLPLHCEYQTDGWQVVDELKSYADDYLDKINFGSLSIDEAVKFLCGENLTEIELCGTCTDICVVSNALILRAMFPNVKMTVNANLCAGLTPEKHEAALNVMESCMIEVVR